MCAEIKKKAKSLQTERNKYVCKRDLNNESDGAHLTSFGIEFQAEEKRKRAITKSCLTVCRSIEKGHDV